MSYRIGLNRFTGEDLESAADQLAKIFRMDKEEASRIVVGLSDGNAWQFPQGVSGKQSQMAQNFLTGLGFEVDLHLIEQELDSDDEEPEEESDKKGLLGKIWFELNKKR
ncbi:MAG: hypothetical protein G3M70_11010 [Candidatus Nitronauta litoralis]|uniref:Uncharacterized protein n=1 Tax=Candidatus Nitronauta litoralis TaxID=2705533 RepID=A0A7T0BWR5_9BACT|nr:MAG: hypothetical protein G3M70_11010 [Candidatus Nitronauta litoralis]